MWKITPANTGKQSPQKMGVVRALFSSVGWCYLPHTSGQPEKATWKREELPRVGILPSFPWEASVKLHLHDDVKAGL
jgi:hypothetical protein